VTDVTKCDVQLINPPLLSRKDMHTHFKGLEQAHAYLHPSPLTIGHLYSIVQIPYMTQI